MKLLRRRMVGLAAGLALTWLSACASAVPRTVVVPPRYPDYLFPTVPADLAGTSAAVFHEAAWLFLQAGDLRSAQRGFESALDEQPAFHPAEAGLGFVGLARGDFEEAIIQFDRALRRVPAYVPALVGSGEAFLGSDRVEEAFGSFDAALGADPALTALRRRVQLLRFDWMQEQVALAREAADAGRYGAARTAYERAITASPESAFLYLEVGSVELREGNLRQALEHARTAAELDPRGAGALMLEGDVRQGMGELEVAEQLYARGRALEPSEELDARLAAVRARLRLASLPAEYYAIPDAGRITRAELAALIGVRFDGLLLPSGGAVIITDTRDHWADRWIYSVAHARLMDVNANYTFQPDVIVNRGELAHVVGRVLNLIAAESGITGRQGQVGRPPFTDIGPRHLSYPAALRAVAAGILPVLPGNSFRPTRPVSGAEAIVAIERLETLEKGQ